MDHPAPETPGQARIRREGEGALVWLAFVAIALLAIAAVINVAIRHGLRQQPPSSVIGVSAGQSAPSPGPPPLPRPGVDPAGV